MHLSIFIKNFLLAQGLEKKFDQYVAGGGARQKRENFRLVLGFSGFFLFLFVFFRGFPFIAKVILFFFRVFSGFFGFFWVFLGFFGFFFSDIMCAVGPYRGG